MPGQFKMDDYVPVNERVDAFYKAYPEGSIQSEVIELTASRVTVKAFAYRTKDDPRPGIGHSSLDIPGSTPYTRGSEVENAETSAWGRAIAALGFEVKRGIASAEEVRNKQPERASPPRPSPASTPAPQPDPPQAVEGGDIYEPSPFENDLAVLTGGELVKPNYVARAEAKAAAQAAKPVQAECPEHGAGRVKLNKRGFYCATKMDDGEWCPWSAKAA